ncbi:MAG: hypothetical protein JWN40_5385, partial [Phycisphaerales bacterium]|nr:hypothetical protein [Phycisphaerales bacterium]
MPDVAQTTPPPPADSTAASIASAHLAELHKMSTTAGVTNLGYVAVNHTAIIAALLGVASVLSFFASLLLVIPLVGVIFAIVAIRQINESSGTQAGKILAITGLLLCILLGGGAITKEAMAIAAVKGDENKIAATLAQVGQYLHDGKYKEAYALHDDDFQNRVKFPQFESVWKSAQSPTPLGRVQSMEWNGVSPSFGSEGGSAIAAAKVRTKFERAQDERFDVVMRRVGDRWLISRFP